MIITTLGGGSTNTPPQIDSGPTATPNPLPEDQTAQLTVTASDADGDPVTYTWTPAQGTITGTGATVTYTPPDVGLVEASDIVRFTPTSTRGTTAGTFAMVLDGSDVELGNTQGEPIDAIGILPDGRIVISTTGNFTALGVSAKDEDLIAFNATQLGPDTIGSWEFYFDGSDVELAAISEDVNGTWVDDTNGDLYLTTRREFSVTGASGDGFDIFVCTPGSVGPNTSCTYQFFWDPQANGLTGGSKVVGLSLGR